MKPRPWRGGRPRIGGCRLPRATAAAPLAALLAALLAAGVRPAQGAGVHSAQAPPWSNLTLPARTQSFSPRVESLRPRVRNLAPVRSRHGDRFTVQSDVLFAFGSAALAPGAEAVLASVIRKLSSARTGTVSIAGYTDSVGTSQYNLRLSRRRAAAVQSFVAGQIGSGTLRYRVAGRGEADPVAPNTLPGGQDNPAGRRLNRRVVITYAPGR